jgi:type IV fimbrial biogenesis protein FimT
MNKRRQLGFTLWELLMTLLVAGLLLGIGVPNVIELQRNGAMTAAANNVLTGMLMARNEAGKQQAPVTWCLTVDPMAATPACSMGAVMNSNTLGFIVWVDENNNTDPATGARILTDATDGNFVVDAGEQILSRSAAPGDPILMSTNCGNISFLPTGFPRTAGAPCNPNERAVLFCDDRGRRMASGTLSTARVVLTNRLGRAQVLSETGPVNTWAAALAVGGANCPVPP